ncbi:hypothetical protein MMO39_12895 [Acinetobacter modestus]|uniref:hypothetical protein n=1 Tax=Acinetobacter modestus TaxID=1776740 RepID=UPI001F4B9715|nr:hypothetical protein [Acinetobacter modestus]MCH7388186.1 hypothetical protein [Acinetobacter modestus]
MFDEINKENEILWNILIQAVEEKGFDKIVENIGSKLDLSESRKKFIKEIIVGINDLELFVRNDILKCLVKKKYEYNESIEKYYELNLLSYNLYSRGTCWEYDPAKNGQNLLKHGLDFGAVANYGGGDFGGLISYTAPGKWLNDDGELEVEERRIVFSKYYAKNVNKKFFLDKFKEDDVFCVASVVSMKDLKFRFISSRTIRAKTLKQLTNELKNLIKDNELGEDIILDLRLSALRVLKEYYGFSLSDTE